MPCQRVSEDASVPAEAATTVEVNYGLPNGNAQVADGHDVNMIKSRLVILINKLKADGTYTRANTAMLALDAIEKLQQGGAAWRLYFLATALNSRHMFWKTLTTSASDSGGRCLRAMNAAVRTAAVLNSITCLSCLSMSMLPSVVCSRTWCQLAIGESTSDETRKH